VEVGDIARKFVSAWSTLYEEPSGNCLLIAAVALAVPAMAVAAAFAVAVVFSAVVLVLLFALVVVFDVAVASLVAVASSVSEVQDLFVSRCPSSSDRDSD